jgi:hypothetical protein
VQIQEKACYHGGMYVDSPCLNHASCFSSIVITTWGRGFAGLSSRELKRPTLRRAGDWWAKAPLSVKVMRISDGSLLFMALGLPHMISCTVYEWPPLHLFLVV